MAMSAFPRRHRGGRMSNDQNVEPSATELPASAAADEEVAKAWAIARLSVGADGPEAVWRSLEECGFLPDGAQVAAVEILAGTAASPETDAYRRIARREALQREIEVFAGQFFDHSPPQREAVWGELRERCGEFPGLARRLDLLAAGLEVLRPAAEGLDDECCWVVESICSLFTAAPAAKSRVQRRLCEDFSFLRQSAVEAVRRIQHDQPELAGLMPGFLERLIAGPLSVSDADRLSRKLRRSTWRILAWSKLMRDPWLATGLLGGTMAATLSIALQSRPHREFENFSVARPISESRLQELSAAVNRQAERIRTYGIAEAEPVALPGSLPMKRYRILGPGPDEFLLEANLILLGIKAEQYLRKDVAEDGDD